MPGAAANDDGETGADGEQYSFGGVGRRSGEEAGGDVEDGDGTGVTQFLEAAARWLEQARVEIEGMCDGLEDAGTARVAGVGGMDVGENSDPVRHRMYRHRRVQIPGIGQGVAHAVRHTDTEPTVVQTGAAALGYDDGTARPRDREGGGTPGDAPTDHRDPESIAPSHRCPIRPT
ncbi:hypothetical protein [Nocardia sp. BMG51109]|uniref:hypothetical protein n=1 Tax=Nocardia sp. BMG51109 TaxID=1056816 RepID=UPI0012EB2484|nr:hypothetical protein [Nocardia sp. BMG51109]